MKMKKKMTGEIEKRDMKVVQGEREPTSIVHINRTSRKIGGEWGEATIKRYRAKARTTATAHKGFFGSFPLSKDGAVPGRLATTSSSPWRLLIPRRDSRRGPIQDPYIRRTQQQQYQRPRTTKMSLRRMCYCCFSSPVTVPAGT